MMKFRRCSSILCLLLVASVNIHGQSFGQALLQGLANGLNNAAKMIEQQNNQKSNNPNQFSLNNSRATNQNSNSFSLANSHAENVFKEVTYNDGSKFYGILKDGRPHSGKMYYADGTYCEGTFDANGSQTGLCYVKYPDQSWYYGYFTAGIRDGEGSLCDSDNNCYDVVFSKGDVVSASAVTSPKYKVAEADSEAVAAFYSELMRQEAEYAAPTSTSSSSSTSRSSRSSTSNIQKQADRTTKAYKMYKSNPNSTSSTYYRSNQRLLNTMQGRK